MLICSFVYYIQCMALDNAGSDAHSGDNVIGCSHFRVLRFFCYWIEGAVRLFFPSFICPLIFSWGSRCFSNSLTSSRLLSMFLRTCCLLYFVCGLIRGSTSFVCGIPIYLSSAVLSSFPCRNRSTGSSISARFSCLTSFAICLTACPWSRFFISSSWSRL